MVGDCFKPLIFFHHEAFLSLFSVRLVRICQSSSFLLMLLGLCLLFTVVCLASINNIDLCSEQ